MLLSAILQAAVTDERALKNPARGIKLPKGQEREKHFLTVEQVEALAREMSEPYDLLVLTLAYSGLRWGEAAALHRERCDLLHSRLRVSVSLSEIGSTLTFGPTKDYQNRWVVIPGCLRDLLAAHLSRHVDASQAPSCSRLRAQALSVPRARRAFVCVCGFRRRRAGLPETVTVHHLGHTHASPLVSQGASVKAVQELLGHASPSVTLNVYTHLFETDQDALASKLDTLRGRTSRMDSSGTLARSEIVTFAVAEGE
jgi:integrase